MGYTYSFDKVRSTLSPADFMQEQNNIWEESESIELVFYYPDIPVFDVDEIL